MRFVDLHLEGFGKLVDWTFRFAPGLNLVYGPNEAGKSTFWNSLVAMLYGFYGDGSVTTAKREAANSFTPWQPDAKFGGSLVYQLDSGAKFRVTRVFSSRPTTRLTALPSERDVSTDYNSASHGRLFFADAQLGMSRDVFENTCAVRQAELFSLGESATAITDTLSRLAASGSRDTTISHAVSLLQQAVRDRIGTDRSWTKPLAESRLRLDELRSVREEVQSKRHELLGLAGELKQSESRHQAASEEMARLRYLASLAEQKSIQDQLDADDREDAETQRLTAEVETLRPYSDFRADLRDDVIRLDSALRNLARQLTEHASRLTQVRKRREELARELAESELNSAKFGDVKDLPPDQLAQAQHLVAQWESAKATAERVGRWAEEDRRRLSKTNEALAEEQEALGSLVDLGVAGLARLQQRWDGASDLVRRAEAHLRASMADWNKTGMSEEDWRNVADVARQVQAGGYVDQQPRSGCRFWGRQPVERTAPPEIAIYADVKPLRERLDRAHAEAEQTRFELNQLEKETATCLGLGPLEEMARAQFESKLKRLEQYGRLLSEEKAVRCAAASTEETAIEAANKETGARNAAIRMLEALGYDTPDPGTCAESLARDLQRQQQYERHTAALDLLRAEDRLMAQEEDAYEQDKRDLEKTTGSLVDLLAQAGIDASAEGLPQAIEIYEDWYSLHLKWLRTSEMLQGAVDRSVGSARAQAKPAARMRLKELTQHIVICQRNHPDWQELVANHLAPEYESRARELEASCQTIRERCIEIHGLIQQASAGIRHPAEIAEELGYTQSRIHRLEYLRDVLDFSRDELQEAAREYQRAFAPRLEEVVASGIDQVTHGRYSTASIDPETLEVSLVTPDRDTVVSAARLSKGTRDLVYLLLRLGISQSMGEGGEALPLLLDDPLVELDRSRRIEALQLLADVAEATQVVLLTKEEDIVEWFQARLAGDSHNLLRTLG